MLFKFKREAIPAVIYFIISMAAYVFALLYIIVTPAKSEFSGVYVAILTLPWSSIGVAILDYFRIEGVAISFILTGVFIAINTLILLLVFGFFRSSQKG